MLQLDYVRNGLAVMTVGFCLALAGPAGAKSVYAWETEDGVSSYTDAAKHIPKRYKAAAKQKTLRSLKSYARFTPSDKKAAGAYAERTHARLAEYRESARASEPAYRHHRRGVGMDVQVSGRDRGAVSLRSGRHGGGETITVDSRRVRVGHEIATRHATIVKQGDRVLSVITGEANVSNISRVQRIDAGYPRP